MARSSGIRARTAASERVGSGMVRGIALTGLIAATGVAPAQAGEPREHKPEPTFPATHCPTLIRFISSIACPFAEITIEPADRREVQAVLASGRKEVH